MARVTGQCRAPVPLPTASARPHGRPRWSNCSPAVSHHPLTAQRLPTAHRRLPSRLTCTSWPTPLARALLLTNHQGDPLHASARALAAHDRADCPLADGADKELIPQGAIAPAHSFLRPARVVSEPFRWEERTVRAATRASRHALPSRPTVPCSAALAVPWQLPSRPAIELNWRFNYSNCGPAQPPFRG